MRYVTTLIYRCVNAECPGQLMTGTALSDAPEPVQHRLSLRPPRCPWCIHRCEGPINITVADLRDKLRAKATQATP